MAVLVLDAPSYPNRLQQQETSHFSGCAIKYAVETNSFRSTTFPKVSQQKQNFFPTKIKLDFYQTKEKERNPKAQFFRHTSNPIIHLIV